MIWLSNTKENTVGNVINVEYHVIYSVSAIWSDKILSKYLQIGHNPRQPLRHCRAGNRSSVTALFQAFER